MLFLHTYKESISINLDEMTSEDRQLKKIRIVSTKTFDFLDLDELDDEMYDLGFIIDYSYDKDGLLKLTIISKPNLFLHLKSRE